MSISSNSTTVVWRFRRVAGWADDPQFDSWPAWLRRLVQFADRARQREALRALADNKHLLDDIGLSRRDALDEADRPFWQ